MNGERQRDDSDVHDHEWQRRQNVTSRGYRMTPYEVCVVDGCDAARQVSEKERAMSDIREALVALLGRPDHAPMSTHDPRDGSCQSCPWPLHEMPPEDIADAILAEFDVTERASMNPGFEDHEAYCHLQHGMGGPCSCKDAPVAPRGEGTTIQIGGSRAGKTQALAERVADEVMKRGGSVTVTSLPPVEDVARACGDPGSVTPRREGESVPRWSARAVLALLPGRSEAEVRQDEAERIAAWVTADEPSDTLVLLADALRRGDHRG